MSPLLAPPASSSAPSQPMTMDALAAKFDGKEVKEKFSNLQLSPALASGAFPEKEKRSPMGSFTASNPSNIIKVQRTTSLHQTTPSNQTYKSPALGSPSKSFSGHLTQPLDMRRSASHNSASTLGPRVAVGGLEGPSGSHGLTQSPPTSTGLGISTNTISSGATHSSSPVLAPFSLRQMTQSPRKSSLHSQDGVASDHQTSSPLPLSGDKHPLQHPWTLYYSAAPGHNRPGTSLYNYENALKDVGTFTTVELFARYFNWIQKPHKMEDSANYHLFKSRIKPMWEDPANTNGGRWIISFPTRNDDLLDRCWMELVYALVGEQLDASDDVCGAVLSRRAKVDRLAVWVRDKDNVEVVNGIGKRLARILGLANENVSMIFQIPTESRSTSTPRSFISLETIKRELAQEAAVSRSSNTPTGGATPGLIPDSLSASPSLASAISPSTPGLKLPVSTGIQLEGKEGSQNGLLISVPGKDAPEVQKSGDASSDAVGGKEA